MTDVRLAFSHGAPAAPARRAAEEALRIWNLSDHADDVLLVITELLQNVTQHTANGGELRLVLRTASILIEVTDTSPAMPETPRHDLRRLGGRGLLLVTAVAMAWGARHTSWHDLPGKVIWAELARQLPGPMKRVPPVHGTYAKRPG